MTESTDDPQAAPDRRSDGMPRWVRVFLIVAIAVIVLVAIVALLGPGDHGPGRHAPDGKGHSAPSGMHMP